LGGQLQGAKNANCELNIIGNSNSQKIIIESGIYPAKVQDMIKGNDLIVLEAKNPKYDYRTHLTTYNTVVNNGYVCIWMKKVKRKRRTEVC